MICEEEELFLILCNQLKQRIAVFLKVKAVAVKWWVIFF